MKKSAKKNAKALLPYQHQVLQWLTTPSPGQTMYSRLEQGNRMKVIKLDRRYNGHNIFKYVIEPNVIGKDDRIKEFKQWREWCWEVFGPSSELGFVQIRPATPYMESTRVWCWDTEFDNLRLYFKDDATLSAVMLQWG
jgi:hypothetical protein